MKFSTLFSIKSIILINILPLLTLLLFMSNLQLSSLGDPQSDVSSGLTGILYWLVIFVALPMLVLRPLIIVFDIFLLVRALFTRHFRAAIVLTVFIAAMGIPTIILWQ